jgi:chaperonin GroEL
MEAAARCRNGSATPPRSRSRRRRTGFDDATHATCAAVEEGIVPSGGATLLFMRRALDALKPANKDRRVDIDIIERGIRRPR